MEKLYIIDGHCDTIGQIMDARVSLNKRTTNHITLEGLREGQVGMQFFAAWVGPKEIYGPYLQRSLRLINSYYNMLETYPEFFYQVLEYNDIALAIRKGKTAALLTIEGGDALEGEIINLRMLYRLGVRALTLTWNFRNEIADGVMEDRGSSGLSNFGYEVIKEMDRLGMLIDVSHISEKGFYDVLASTKNPILATHSNAKGVCNHPRNLTDQQIKAIADKKGVVGINFYPPFLSNQLAGLDDIIRHIEYIASLAGIDILGFGADFDGIDKLPFDIAGPEGYNTIIEALLKLNYTEDQIHKIAYGNYLRVLKEVLSL